MDKIEQQIIELCSHLFAKTSCDVEQNNASVDELILIFETIKLQDDLAQQLYGRLLQHEDDKVRFEAATCCFKMQYNVKKAKCVLKQIAKTNQEPVIRFSAERVLEFWNRTPAVDYKQQYLILCEQLNDCTTRDKVRKHNKAMKELGKLFRSLKENGDARFLAELLDHNDPYTSMTAAAHCLGLGIYIPQATRALKKIASTQKGVVAFNAQSTLDVWTEQGFLAF